MRVLITGVSGQLGHDAAKVLTETGKRPVEFVV